MHSITRRDEMLGGGGVKWEDSGGGGGRLLYTNLYMSRVKWYDNTHKLFNPIKKGLLLTAIQIRGTAETRRCVADAVRLQVITLNAPLTLRASYLPLPPPSSSPCSRTCPLSPSSLIQHMVYRGVSTQLPLIKIIGILNLQLTFFALLFLRCFIPVHFSQYPLPKKCTPFFCWLSIRKSFSCFLLCHNFFTPSKWICQLLISKNLKPPC
jgi:hypothetical protein